MFGLPRAGATTFPTQTLIAVTLLAALMAACGSPASGHAGTPSATRQIHVAPVMADGGPAAGFRTVRTRSHAMCEPGSEAIGLAYRCFAGNLVYDPCWAVQAATPTVLCLPYPWQTTDIRLSVSAPLGPIPNPGPVSEPWGVQLVNGQRCVLLQGAHSLFQGHAIDYFCNPRLFLLRGLSRATALWRAQSVVEKSGKFSMGHSAEISVAWFGRPDTFR